MVDADNGIGEAGWRVVGGLRRFGSIILNPAVTLPS